MGGTRFNRYNLFTVPGEEQLFHNSLNFELNFSLVIWTKDVDWWPQGEKNIHSHANLHSELALKTRMSSKTAGVEKISVLLPHILYYWQWLSHNSLLKGDLKYYSYKSLLLFFAVVYDSLSNNNSNEQTRIQLFTRECLGLSV